MQNRICKINTGIEANHLNVLQIYFNTIAQARFSYLLSSCESKNRSDINAIMASQKQIGRDIIAYSEDKHWFRTLALCFPRPMSPPSPPPHTHTENENGSRITWGIRFGQDGLLLSGHLEPNTWGASFSSLNQHCPFLDIAWSLLKTINNEEKFDN